MTSRSQAARLANPLRARAADTIRYHIKQGHLIRPDCCDKCGNTSNRPIGVPADLTRPREDITWLCTACHKAAFPRKPVVQPPRLQNIRKLPPYRELKRMVMPPALGGLGMTYFEIAEKYKCSRVVVNRTLKDRAMKLGEWPLPIDQSAKLKRSVQVHSTTVSSVGIGWLLDEYLKDHPKYFAVDIDGVCTPTRFTLKKFGEWHGFPARYLTGIRRGKRSRISKAYARRLLIALGEPVPKHLRERKAA